MKDFSRTFGTRRMDINNRKHDVATIKLIIARHVNCIFKISSSGAAEASCTSVMTLFSYFGEGRRRCITGNCTIIVPKSFNTTVICSEIGLDSKVVLKHRQVFFYVIHITIN